MRICESRRNLEAIEFICSTECMNYENVLGKKMYSNFENDRNNSVIARYLQPLRCYKCACRQKRVAFCVLLQKLLKPAHSNANVTKYNVICVANLTYLSSIHPLLFSSSSSSYFSFFLHLHFQLECTIRRSKCIKCFKN